MPFTLHTVDTAPEGSRQVLEGYRKRLGFVPNLMAVMAASPAAIEGYVSLNQLFEKSSLTPAERQVVLLSASAANGCGYCMAAHSVIAKMQGVPDAVVAALRDGEALPDEKLQALRAFTRSVVETRGYPTQTVMDAFLKAGYGRTQVLEVILGVAMKTLSNYVNHVAQTPLDDIFEPARWEQPQSA
ncbi:MAG: carboxymuconolactone decarboxylase family protein [Elusimicrobia bacterium]|nr:carboxymuconolactone decarboxylase family protein [Elusimicrobiota bacterium]